MKGEEPTPGFRSISNMRAPNGWYWPTLTWEPYKNLFERDSLFVPDVGNGEQRNDHIAPPLTST
jgi:hypothetical protein